MFDFGRSDWSGGSGSRDDRENSPPGFKSFFQNDPFFRYIRHLGHVILKRRKVSGILLKTKLLLKTVSYLPLVKPEQPILQAQPPSWSRGLQGNLLKTICLSSNQNDPFFRFRLLVGHVILKLKLQREACGISGQEGHWSVRPYPNKLRILFQN